MLLIGHRGVPSLEPENTVRSFQKAQECGVDMIEFDVRESADGQLVVIHDSHLTRLFAVDKPVRECTLAELKSISRPAGREIPTVAEALQSIRVPVDIHVKVHGIEERLMAELKNFSPKVLISCTYPGVLQKIRTLDEKVNLGLLIGTGELHLIPVIHWLVRNLNLYSIHPKLSLTSAWSIKALKTLGKKVFVWTVNDQAAADKLKRLKVDGIFTDFADLIKS